MHLLLSGRPVQAPEAVGWLIDYAGPLEDVLAAAWKIATGTVQGMARREVEEGALEGIPDDVSGLAAADSPAMDAGRAAIRRCVRDACGVPLDGPLHRIRGGPADGQTEGAQDGGDQHREEDAPHDFFPETVGCVDPTEGDGRLPEGLGGTSLPPGTMPPRWRLSLRSFLNRRKA